MAKKWSPGFFRTIFSGMMDGVIKGADFQHKHTVEGIVFQWADGNLKLTK
jgi:hypothetical protein